MASFSQGPEIPKRINLAMALIHYSTREPAKQLNHKTKIQASLLTASGQRDENNWFLVWKTKRRGQRDENNRFLVQKTREENRLSAQN